MKNLLIITQKVDKNDQLLGFFIDWISRFAQNFGKVTVLCLEKGEFNLSENVRVISLGKDRGVSKPVQLFNFYKFIFGLKNDYDIVLVHMNPIWVVLGGFSWRMMNKKIFLWYTHKAVTPKLRLAEKFADTIFTASPESFRLFSRKVIVTGHGIDADLFSPGQGEKAYDGVLRILSVGRISPVKNYETLVKAGKIMREQGKDFHVTLVGEPALASDKAYEATIKELVRAHDLTNKFTFLGKISHRNLPDIYRKHDVFVHLSRTGSLDKAVLEAMASGLNVLSCNDSARAFLPKEFIFEDNDPIGLAEKIVAVSDKSPQSNLKDYVVKNHGLNRLIKKISDLMDTRKKILISGYTYVDESSLRTFDYYPNSESEVKFLVPDVWPMKKGLFVYKAPKQKNVQGAKAFFVHSNYPIIGGVLKAWMPIFPLVVAKQRPDIVYSVSEPNLLTTLYYGVFAKLFGAKHIILVWENLPYTKFKGLRGIIQRFIVRVNILLCDGFVCGSEKTQHLIESLTTRRTVVMPSTGQDIEFFKKYTDGKTQHNTNQAHPVTLTFIGAIDYRKGVHLIVKAFEELTKTMTNIRLVIAGNGGHQQEVESMIQTAGLSKLVTRIPWLDRKGVREVLNNSDVFLYPSIPHKGWEEQFGFALLEASLMELPIITTKSGSISEVVLDGKTGILIEPNDVRALEGAMRTLVNNEQLRIRMGKAGRQFISDNYSYQAIATKLDKFFNSF